MHTPRKIRAAAVAIAIAVTASLMVVVAPAHASTALGVQTLVPGVTASPTVAMATYNNKVYFNGNNGINGSELWTTDGTAAGTVMLKDMHPSANGNPQNFGVSNGTLFFSGEDSTSGAELFKSDGTAAGTVLVKDLKPGSTSSLNPPANLTDLNGTLLFAGNDSGGTGGAKGTELWKSDGTEAGTMMVKDIRTGTASSAPASFRVFNGEAFFTATDGTTGIELWKTDGTTAGTVLLKDINTGSPNGVAATAPLTIFGGRLYFSANDGVNGFELWSSDGTTAGTAMVKDIHVGSSNSNPSSVVIYNGAMFFGAATTFDSFTQTELWKSDGTAAGTVMVVDIIPSWSAGVSQLVVVNSTLFFSAAASTNPFGDSELFKTDGTAAGTVMVRDINAGINSGVPTQMTNVNGTLFLRATSGSLGAELWTSDGTTAGTVLVADINPGSFNASVPQNMIVINNSLFFVATGGATGNQVRKVITNNSPAAVDDAYSTNEDTALAPSAPGVLANDTDADGHPLTAVLAAGPAHGILSLNANGSFSYTPAPNYNGPDSFTYKGRDGIIGPSGPVESDTAATVNITVTSVNDNPVAVTDSYSTNQNSPVTVSAPGVLGNDSDIDGGTLSAGSASLPAHGAVALNANGGFTYTPNASYSGPDSFTYVLSDGQGGNATGTVNITVSMPTISASPASVSAGSQVTATWSGIAAPSGTDWVGLYDSASAPDPALLAWAYTGGAAAGNLNLTVPLSATPGGAYELRLFANNTYTRLATSAPFTVTASAATLAASPPSVPAGGAVTGTWSGIAAPTATDWVGLYDSASAPDAALLAWAYTGGAAGGNLNLTVPLGSASGAGYELRLFANNTYTRLAISAPFTVVASNPTVSASPASVTAGTPVTATWSGIPAPSATDWVGLYASSGDGDPAIVAWTYTNGSAAGSSPLTVPAGATPGTTYELRLFSNNTYTRLATSGPFTVTAAGPPATISSSVATVARGNPLTATWSGIASPTATDWVGLYATGTDPDSAIVAWAYTGGAAAGSLNLVVPLSAPTGSTYELRLYSNNTYTRLATSTPPFTVT